MDSETPFVSNPAPRNRAAQASCVISLIFLIQCVAFLAIICFYMSSWCIRLVTTNPPHPLAGLGEAVVELSILFFPLDLIAGALVFCSVSAASALHVAFLIISGISINRRHRAGHARTPIAIHDGLEMGQ